MEIVERQSKPGKSGIAFINLLKGNVPLWITYWVFGVLVNLFFRLILKVVQYNYASLSMYKVFPSSLLAFSWFQIAYSFFIAIAIWKSAVKYKGKTIWAVLAMIGAIGGFIMASANIIMLVNHDKTSDAALETEVRLVNAGLPVKIDDITELVHMGLINGNITYSYKIISDFPMDIDFLRHNMTAILKKKGCNAKGARLLLDRNRELIHVYKNKLDTVLFEIKISKGDCW